MALIYFLLTALALFLTSCSEQLVKTELAQTESERHAWYFHLIEINSDSFPQELVLYDSMLVAEPFEWSDGSLRIDPVYASTVDLTATEFANLQLLNPDKALIDCQVFIRHDIVYEGQGRSGRETKYYASSEFPSVIKLNILQLPESATIQFDPTVAPFEQAVDSIRVFPPNAELEISRNTEEAFNCVFNSTIATIMPGETLDLSEQSLSLNVMQKATFGRDYIFDESFELDPGETDSSMVEAPVDYGSIRFTTSLSLIYLGRAEMVVESTGAVNGSHQLKRGE